MEPSEIELDALDLDWFATDSKGLVGHFATGGRGLLPRSVKSAIDDMRKLNLFFRNQSFRSTSATITQGVDLRLSFENALARSRYVQDFAEMASRGLFSFDYIPTDAYPAGYFQVALPETPINVTSLPPAIQEILLRTTVRCVSFDSVQEIREFE